MEPENKIGSETRLTGGAWLVVGLLFIVGALNYLDRTMITTMRSSIIEAMPMTEGQFGLLTSVFLWTYGLLSPFAGFLADRFNRSRVIIGSLFVWSAVTWMTAHATTFEQLLATRALMGISEACYIPAALALIVDYHKGSTRSLATGIHLAGVMVGQSLGFIGGWLAEKHDWSYVFNIFGIIGIVYAIFLVFILKDPPGDKNLASAKEIDTRPGFLKAIKGLISNKSFLLLLLFWGLMGIVGWLVIGWLPTYYKEHFNLSQSLAGVYSTGYIYPASIVGLLLGGFIADRWSRSYPYARILVPVIGLCIAAPSIFIGSFTSLLPLTILFFMLFMLTKMFVDTNLMPVLCMVADPRFRATGYGVLNMFATVIGGVGLYAAGVMRDSNINLNRVFQFASLIILICVILLLIVKGRFRYSKEQE
jgi:MFS family permease